MQIGIYIVAIFEDDGDFLDILAAYPTMDAAIKASKEYSASEPKRVIIVYRTMYIDEPTGDTWLPSSQS